MKDQSLRKFARTLLKAYQVRSARSIDLTETLRRGTTKSWQHQEVICKEGTPSDFLFILRRGTVRVTRYDYQGQTQELAILQAPCILGQMGLIDGSTRSATCTAQGSVEALCIDLQTFETLMDEESTMASAFRQQVIGVMMNNLYECNHKLSGLLPLDCTVKAL